MSRPDDDLRDRLRREQATSGGWQLPAPTAATIAMFNDSPEATAERRRIATEEQALWEQRLKDERERA